MLEKKVRSQYEKKMNIEFEKNLIYERVLREKRQEKDQLLKEIENIGKGIDDEVERALIKEHLKAIAVKNTEPIINELEGSKQPAKEETLTQISQSTEVKALDRSASEVSSFIGGNGMNVEPLIAKEVEPGDVVEGTKEGSLVAEDTVDENGEFTRVQRSNNKVRNLNDDDYLVDLQQIKQLSGANLVNIIKKRAEADIDGEKEEEEDEYVPIT